MFVGSFSLASAHDVATRSDKEKCEPPVAGHIERARNRGAGSSGYRGRHRSLGRDSYRRGGRLASRGVAGALRRRDGVPGEPRCVVDPGDGTLWGTVVRGGGGSAVAKGRP